jgi:hypothetical protein
MKKFFIVLFLLMVFPLNIFAVKDPATEINKAYAEQQIKMNDMLFEYLYQQCEMMKKGIAGKRYDDITNKSDDLKLKKSDLKVKVLELNQSFPAWWTNNEKEFDKRMDIRLRLCSG